MEELILNSIDAGATEIKVDIHLPSILPALDNIPQIVVHDNGETETHTLAALYLFICVNWLPYFCSIGHGIHIEQLKNFVAEWNFTSKESNAIGSADTHGCKGEALSAIRALSSKLEICSRELNSPFSYLKVMRAKCARLDPSFSVSQLQLL